MRSHVRRVIFPFLLTACCVAQQPAPKEAPIPGSAADLVQRGVKLSRDGKQDEAIALYRQALAKTPGFYPAHLETGAALDLKGEYAKAQEHLTKAVEVAPADSKEQALRALAFSYAFQGDAFKAAEPEMQVFNARLAKGDSAGAAGACNELARIYLELGDPDHMRFYLYLTGYTAFYAGDYKTAIAELQKADMHDPFILVLVGQAYEKSG